MSGFASRSSLAEPARTLFSAAMVIFAYTIVIGILNGLDVWEPEHDVLMSHVHSGTLGWITLGVAGVIFLMYSRDRESGAAEQRQANALAWALVLSIALYVLAFLAGDSIFDDRIQRPIVGTLLFVVVVWFLVWMVGSFRSDTSPSAAKLGLLLSWVSLLIGAVFGVILGLYTSNGEVPGLDDDVAGRFADAHPPAMVIGYLLVAGFSIVEWLLHDDDTGRGGTIQVWLLFVAGVVINVAFVTGKDEELAGPANLLMIAAGVMLLWRSRSMLTPASFRDAGVGRFPRFAVAFLMAYLALLTVLVSWIIRDVIEFEALTETQRGLLLAFDHTAFIGVMTSCLFGVLASQLSTSRTDQANRILWIGVNVGIVGFAIGLISTTAILKQIFAPIMGLALLAGLALYFVELSASRSGASGA